MAINTKNAVAAIILSMVFCCVISCAGSDLEVTAIAISENPKAQVNRLGNELANARKNNVNVLSPRWYTKAESSYDEAKRALDSGGEIARIMHNVSLGDAELARAREIAALSRTTLPDVIRARDLARDAGATNLLKEYVEAESRFLELTEAIEDDEMAWAQKNQHKIAEIFSALELDAIKYNTIGRVQKLIAQAEDEDADERVPETLRRAKAAHRDADEFISQHRYEKEEMHTKARNALFQAQRLVKLNEQAMTFQKMQPEEIVLWGEGILHGITKKLSAPDMRNEIFDTQYKNVIATITVLKNDHEFMIAEVKNQRAEIDDMRDRIESLEGRTRAEQEERKRLAAENKFQKLYLEVTNYFKPDEAEVYKQGRQLVIRLRTIHFPVGSFVLMPDNYELLSKVQRSIRVFGEPKVVIEGHTDSTGSDAVNERLSQQRAESVRQYFIANAKLPADKVVGVGYGSQKPLASNKTGEGRAVNRRIDIIVIP